MNASPNNNADNSRAIACRLLAVATIAMLLLTQVFGSASARTHTAAGADAASPNHCVHMATDAMIAATHDADCEDHTTCEGQCQIAGCCQLPIGTPQSLSASGSAGIAIAGTTSDPPLRTRYIDSLFRPPIA